jgi:hypothetical protein
MAKQTEVEGHVILLKELFGSVWFVHVIPVSVVRQITLPELPLLATSQVEVDGQATA